MAKVFRLTRRELYTQVWAEPMLRLAQRYGLSDVGLAKICRKHDIPLPPRGHWAKLQFGKGTRQIELPNAAAEETIEIHGNPESPDQGTNGRSPFADDLAAEKAKRQPIVIRDSLKGCHPLVEAADREFQNAKAGSDPVLRIEGKPTLRIFASKSGLRRALLAMDALLRDLERRGYSVSPGPQVEIFGQRVDFEACELFSCERTEISDEEILSKPYVFNHSRYNVVDAPTGEMEFQIVDPPSEQLGLRRRVRETKNRSLEQTLGLFVDALVGAAVRLKEHQAVLAARAAALAEAQRRAELEAEQARNLRRRYEEEQTRVKRLSEEVLDWTRSEEIRRFVTAKLARAAAVGEAARPGSPLAAWAEWALQQADRLDPLTKSPPSILDSPPPPEPKFRDWRF